MTSQRSEHKGAIGGEADTAIGHRYPESLLTAERAGDIGDLIAWECARCGQWVSELHPPEPCQGG